jgi:hypothetical protein
MILILNFLVFLKSMFHIYMDNTKSPLIYGGLFTISKMIDILLKYRTKEE